MLFSKPVYPCGGWQGRLFVLLVANGIALCDTVKNVKTLIRRIIVNPWGLL